jgi:hypothetical protein
MEKQAQRSLRAGYLNFTELTAIAIALISPTMTGALIIPLMYNEIFAGAFRATPLIAYFHKRIFMKDL